jgi:hypothetical protein
MLIIKNELNFFVSLSVFLSPSPLSLEGLWEVLKLHYTLHTMHTLTVWEVLTTEHSSFSLFVNLRKLQLILWGQTNSLIIREEHIAGGA